MTTTQSGGYVRAAIKRTRTPSATENETSLHVYALASGPRTHAHAAGSSYPFAPVLTVRTAESMICSSRLLWAPRQYTWPQSRQREKVW